ncbi:MAG: hypothetical protein JSW40_04440 [Candidatus Omnitrophota bacterium]|nr:MAG: hypothetical protein JSW40_04440 [Candidatus Omnitrophota bacterium]
MVEKKRSVGVTVLAIIYMLNMPITILITAIIFSFISKRLSFSVFPYIIKGIIEKGSMFMGVHIIGFIVGIIIGYNILKLRDWARKLVIFLSIIELVLSLFSFVTLSPTKIVPFFGLIYLCFFTRPKVKEQFK